jgi:hypothetical protein
MASKTVIYAQCRDGKALELAQAFLAAIEEKQIERDKSRAAFQRE